MGTRCCNMSPHDPRPGADLPMLCFFFFPLVWTNLLWHCWKCVISWFYRGWWFRDTEYQKRLCTCTFEWLPKNYRTFEAGLDSFCIMKQPWAYGVRERMSWCDCDMHHIDECLNIWSPASDTGLGGVESLEGERGVVTGDGSQGVIDWLTSCPC